MKPFEQFASWKAWTVRWVMLTAWIVALQNFSWRSDRDFLLEVCWFSCFLNFWMNFTWSFLAYFVTLILKMVEMDILLMEEILHQLIGSLSHYLQRFTTISGGAGWCRISEPSTVPKHSIFFVIFRPFWVFHDLHLEFQGWKNTTHLHLEPEEKHSTHNKKQFLLDLKGGIYINNSYLWHLCSTLM